LEESITFLDQRTTTPFIMDKDIFDDLDSLIFRIEVFDDLTSKEQRGLVLHFWEILQTFTSKNYPIFFSRLFPSKLFTEQETNENVLEICPYLIDFLLNK